MPRPIATVLIIAALVTLFSVVFHHPKTKDQVVDTYGLVKDQAAGHYGNVKDQVVDSYGNVKDQIVDSYGNVKDQVAGTYDGVARALQGSYILNFEPLKEAKTQKEVDQAKKNLDSLLADYQKYIEKDLGSKIRYKYDETVQGFNIQIENSAGLLKALGKKALKDKDITLDKLNELFYKFKGNDLKRLGYKLKLEKDKLVKQAY